jgi:hypothetical protein
MVAKKGFYTKHDRGLVVYIDGKSAAVSDTHEQYAAILSALKKSDYEQARRLMSVGDVINSAGAAIKKGKRRIYCEKGDVMYIDVDGRKQKLQGPLVDRIIDSVGKGLTEKAIMPLMLFMDNLQKNKLKDIREELYQFLMSGKMPITQDGCFLAYKVVNKNFTDMHTGKIDNSPGKLVAMAPSAVDTDRHNLCSTGLHFCSRRYLSTFGGPTTVVVKINPRFVFAIPTDYQNAKGRASEYFVVGECTGDPSKDEAFLEPFVFDETKHLAAPKVKFIGSIKESLAARAEGYDLAKNGVAWVRVATAKGKLPAEKYSIVRGDGRKLKDSRPSKFVSAITGQPVPRDHVEEMSITTKSVRSALVRAVAKNRHR